MRMCERELMLAHQSKARSASICVSSGGGESGGAGVAASTPPGSRRRGRPAARSQSARVPGPNPAPGSRAGRRANHHTVRAGHATSGSDTRLEAAGLQDNPLGRRGSTRRAVLVSSSGCQQQQQSGQQQQNSQQQQHGSYHQHRKSTAFLDVPDPPSPTAQQAEDQDSLRIRSFSFNSKGTGIINRGDSFRKRRSRSNSLAGGGTPPPQPAPVAAAPPQVTLTPVNSPGTGPAYRVAMIGAQGVGKTALVSQFMTSECINAYDRQRDEPCQQSVYVMLNGEESEMKFITEALDEPETIDAFIVMYSIIDKASFQKAESELSRLHKNPLLRNKPVILVANKIDLVRSRAVSPQDGKCVACTYGAKFIEVSVGINHNVDELLVGTLTQIRLKEANSEPPSHQSALSSRHWYNSHGVLRASLKARQMFTWIFGKEDAKFKNCENLHVL